MRQKVALILFHSTSGFEAQKEAMFHKVLAEMESEGRVATSVSPTPLEKMARFNDGSRLIMMPLTKYQHRGVRITHLYLDKSVYSVKGGNHFVKNILLPIVMPQGEYSNIDATDNAMDRIHVFEVKNGNLKVDKFKSKGE